MSVLRQRRTARLVGLGAASLVFLLAAALSPQRAAACSLLEAEVCVETNSGGVATINVPPLSLVAKFKPELAQYEDCIWEKVEVNFGDGSGIFETEWDASQGLQGSHTFPAPGEYHVQIETNEGRHATKPPSPCPDLVINARVIYPTPPPPPKEEMPPPQPPPKEKPKKEQESPSRGSGAAGPGGGSGSGQAPTETNSVGAAQYWRSCRGSVDAHRVGCEMAERLIGRARRRLSGHRSVLVAGFRCHLDGDRVRPVSCRRGERRAIGPDSA